MVPEGAEEDFPDPRNGAFSPFDAAEVNAWHICCRDSGSVCARFVPGNMRMVAVTNLTDSGEEKIVELRGVVTPGPLKIPIASVPIQHLAQSRVRLSEKCPNFFLRIALLGFFSVSLDLSSGILVHLEDTFGHVV